MYNYNKLTGHSYSTVMPPNVSLITTQLSSTNVQQKYPSTTCQVKHRAYRTVEPNPTKKHKTSPTDKEPYNKLLITSNNNWPSQTKKKNQLSSPPTIGQVQQTKNYLPNLTMTNQV